MIYNYDMSEVSKIINIKAIISNSKLSKYEICKRANIPYTTLYRILKDKVKMSYQTWCKLANVLNLDINTGEPLSNNVDEILNNFDKDTIEKAYLNRSNIGSIHNAIIDFLKNEDRILITSEKAIVNIDNNIDIECMLEVYNNPLDIKEITIKKHNSINYNQFLSCFALCYVQLINNKQCIDIFGSNWINILNDYINKKINTAKENGNEFVLNYYSVLNKHILNYINQGVLSVIEKKENEGKTFVKRKE